MHNEPLGGARAAVTQRSCAVIDETRWCTRKEVVFTWIGIVFTLAACIAVAWEQGPILADQIAQRRWGEIAAHGVFLAIVVLLIYGSFVYQATRLGYVKRRAQHRPVSGAALDALFNDRRKPLTILVPSYREDRRVIFQTLMSAALQEYPERRVVLLVDDPPHPKTAAEAALLADARELPLHIAALLARAAKPFDHACASYARRSARGECNRIDAAREIVRLAELWQRAAAWFAREADVYPIVDHTDRLFVDKVLRSRADAHTRHAGDLLKDLAQGKTFDDHQLRTEYRKLGALFSCELASFERKRYENLSHESNKAMNLNSYIGLVGRSFRERTTDSRLFLDEVDIRDADFSVPDADYFITLDADSILLPEYALRLIHVLEQPGNERIAVVQTPYSAVPGAPSELERIAGATTDMQYIIHQGFTQHNATYWVGANALLRHAALKEIAVCEIERGYAVQRFIQDRTVIEDTESSVDLAVRGWRLYNYPERLAYSATPPDFGSLIIQRRRWANGGLIILPKLLGYLCKRPQGGLREALLRSHYLISIAAVNIGLLLMLALPFGESIESVLLPLSALPYFWLYGRDLLLCGYRRTDLFKIYALNLLLIPVNLGGVLKSLQQGYTGKKIPFGRTPKVRGRTAAAPLYLIAGYALFAQWLFGAALNFHDGYYSHAIFASVNAAVLLYAIRTFIGYRESWEDLRACWSKRSAPTSLALESNSAALPAIDNELILPQAQLREADVETPTARYGT